MSRAAFHRHYAEQANAEARRLLAERDTRGAGWLAWVAGELYRLGPAEYAAMVRRELQRLSEQ